MITVYFSGRTGNQMFQYAFVRKLIEERGCKDKVVFNFGLVKSSGKASDGFVDTFKDFPVYEHTVDGRNLVLSYASPGQKALWLAYKAELKLRRLSAQEEDEWFRRFTLHGLLFTRYSDNDYPTFTPPRREKILQINKLTVYGKFENPKFFDDIKPILQREFTPLHPEREENKELYDVIRSTNSVCVHVRRGDYLAEEFKKTFFVCGEDYFIHALSDMSDCVSSPTFIFFSNDIEWVKANIKISAPCFYESGHDPVWETLRLMSSCKHFIISNSTLSWWAQYLSSNPNKVVISPDRWYNDPEMNSHARLLQPEFVKIPRQQ